MSFLYRPTPVVNLGSGQFSSKQVLYGVPGAHHATMHGIPAGASPLGKGAPTGAISAGRRVDTRMQPWLKSSGTMGSFIPNGLGQVLGDDSFDFSGDISPDVPDFTPPPIVAPDFGPGVFAPNIPALVSPSAGPLAPIPIEPSMYSAPSVLTPPAGAGPTGTGIPGTQPLNLQPSAQPGAIASAAASVSNAFKSIFSPTPAAPAGYKALPGYGGAPVAAGSSFLAQSSIFPGTPNSTVIFGGLALLVLLPALFAGGKK